MLVIRVQDHKGNGPYNDGPDSWKDSMKQVHGVFWDSEHQPLPDFNSCTSDHVVYYEEAARFCFMNYVQFERWFTDDYIPYIKKDYFVVVFDVKTGHAVSDRKRTQGYFDINQAVNYGMIPWGTHEEMEKCFLNIKRKYNTGKTILVSQVFDTSKEPALYYSL